MSVWTLAQHHEFRAGNLLYAHAVEPVQTESLGDVLHVKEVGGLLFQSWEAASAAAHRENFPDGTSAVPRARGRFSDRRVRGQRVYLPRCAQLEADKEAA